MSFEEHLPEDWNGRIPPPYRYIEREYVEMFFDTGRPMLTTYKRCAEMEDKSRADAREGKLNTLVRGPDGYAIAGISGVGRCSYMFCTSLKQNLDVMAGFEGANAHFRIDDPRAFAREVAAEMSGYQSGLMGACVYMPERSLEATAVSNPDFSEIEAVMRSEDTEAIGRAIDNFRTQLGRQQSALVGAQAYFAKVASTHEDESEFRSFGWLTMRRASTHYF